MKRLKILNNPIARSTLFVIFVGGLFTFSSYLFCQCCNSVILANFTFPCISFLESAGIMSFAYIIFFGFKYGFSRSDNKIIPESPDHAILSDDCAKNVDKMTATERNDLKSKLENYLKSEKV